MAAYDDALAERPMIVALNKIDLTEAREQLDALAAAIRAKGFTVFGFGATGEGVQVMLECLSPNSRHFGWRNGSPRNRRSTGCTRWKPRTMKRMDDRTNSGMVSTKCEGCRSSD
ncbi:MAG: hypothetical protein R2839_02335 [Thermomicrobiales bacterium]